jgi:RNA polymerase sigma factor (sigma-70 family)
MLELSKMIATAVVDTLESRGLVVSSKVESKPMKQKTAYQKTEMLLYNYNSFKKTIDERMLEIETLKTCGVPNKSASIVEYSPGTKSVHGIRTVQESVDCAIRSVQASVHDTVQAISLIDKCMDSLKGDPYYCILEMRYIEGRTQEDIADYLGVSQVSVSKNKKRLIKELSIKLFPNQAITEMFD